MSASAAGTPGASAAEEAARLFEALQAWARRAAPGAEADGAEPVVGGSSTCRLCPWCQLLSGLRQTRPEVFGHLVDAGDSLLAAVRLLIAAHEDEWASRRSAGIQHIDVDSD